ncbi:thermonuclease family protein [Nitrosomonas sp. Nm34]|uniref:thermonuclease family protein n=1 Tax=Nitrosomonas sp. Nm34 TaxID=1881055 RepID=UPI0008DFC73C|nr:thermonuclease family protein [Nitrosomonas sp. Nm34]SFI31692.1 Endonuclease YncB, thermonuclease family [Nitrosomonas sp. Nm34]
MKPIITISLFWLLTVFIGLHLPGCAADTIYRTQDAQGNITYSDIPAPDAKPLNLSPIPHRTRHQVVKVLDGDTVVLNGGERVRLLGINAPEVKSRYRDGEAGSIAAKEWLQEKLKNRKVYLEYDQQKHDHYNRLLAHLYLPNGEHLNLMLVEKGLAVVNLLPPNLRHADAMIRAQQRAERQKSGIWSLPDYRTRPLTQISQKSRGWQRFLGTPMSLKKNKRYSQLILNNKVDIRIDNNNLALFPVLETYLHKSLEIRGWVSHRNDHYSILIHHPSALVLR